MKRTRRWLLALMVLLILFLALVLAIIRIGGEKKAEESTQKPAGEETAAQEVTAEPDGGIAVTETPVEAPDDDHTMNWEPTESPTMVPAQEPPLDIQTADGYVLWKEENIMCLDLENPEYRVYPQEGKDRGVFFDVSQAKVELLEIEGLTDLQAADLRTSLTVSVDYYVENGNNVAVTVRTDGMEVEMAGQEVLASGIVTAVSQDILSVDVTEATQSERPSERVGQMEFTLSPLENRPELAVGMQVSMVYYYDYWGVREGNYVTELVVEG